MQQNLEQLRPITDAMSQPVFAIRNGQVSYANSAFSEFQIALGTPINSFFGCQQPILRTEPFDCTVAGLPCTANAFPLSDCILYVLRLHEQSVSANALSSAVRSLRFSLHGMYSALPGLCERIEDAEDERLQTQSAAILQEIYRMEHTMQNLELLQKLFCGSYTLKPERMAIVAFLSELFSHAEELLGYSDIRLITELPEKMFNGNLDAAIAQTVIWNAIANAAGNTKDKTVQVRCAHRGDLLQITVINCGELSAQSQNRLFSRYQIPAEEATDPGGGFGLPVIRQAVMLHGGTMLFAVSPEQTVAFTVTFDLSKEPIAEVHSPIPVERGLDPGLVHLSTVLPRSAYDSRDIL